MNSNLQLVREKSNMKLGAKNSTHRNTRSLLDDLSIPKFMLSLAEFREKSMRELTEAGRKKLSLKRGSEEEEEGRSSNTTCDTAGSVKCHSPSNCKKLWMRKNNSEQKAKKIPSPHSIKSISDLDFGVKRLNTWVDENPFGAAKLAEATTNFETEGDNSQIENSPVDNDDLNKTEFQNFSQAFLNSIFESSFSTKGKKEQVCRSPRKLDVKSNFEGRFSQNLGLQAIPQNPEFIKSTNTCKEDTSNVESSQACNSKEGILREKTIKQSLAKESNDIKILDQEIERKLKQIQELQFSLKTEGKENTDLRVKFGELCLGHYQFSAE